MYRDRQREREREREREKERERERERGETYEVDAETRARFHIRSRREPPVRNEEVFERATKTNSDDEETNRAVIDIDVGADAGEPSVQRMYIKEKEKKGRERKKERKRKIGEIRPER